MLVYFFKKNKRLRRKAVFFPCQAVQPEKFPSRFLRRETGNGHTLLDGLLDVPLRTVPKTRINRFFRTRKIEVMTAISGKHRYRIGKRHRVSNLDLFPPGRLPVTDDRTNPILHNRISATYRRKIIGKWERDTPPSCQEASDFHERDNHFMSSVGRNKILRMIPVGFAQHTGPTRGEKIRKVRMGRHDVVPSRVLHGV